MPKGWPIGGCTPRECAAREAMEEAGVLGVIAPEPIGAFPHSKRRKSGAPVHCRVDVFLLQVTHQLRDWPEKSLRERRWCPVDDALVHIADPGLRRLIAKFAESGAPVRIAARAAAPAAA